MAATFTDEGMKLYWFPIDTTLTGTWDALKVADFAVTGVVDLSDFAVVGGCEFVAAASDTIDEKVYSDKGKVSVPTYSNYTGKGQYRRDRTEGTGVLSADDIVALFDNRAEGYIVKRLGLPEATAIAADQDYEYFRYLADYIATINDANGGYEQVEVGYLQKGDHGFGAVAASA
jgi:hypothetical protein